MNNDIYLGKQKFTFVKKRYYTSVRVYKGDNCFLKIGKKHSIDQSIAAHTALIQARFPVPTILKIGTLNSYHYFIESSLGTHHFGEIFTKEFQESGVISTRSFNEYLSIIEKFAEAQTKEQKNKETFRQFGRLIHLNLILKELPQLSEPIQEAFNRIQMRLKNVPFVLSHGDLNPHNIYKLGVNDTEQLYLAPFGYDLITNLVHIYFFPIESSYELVRGYEFTTEQHEEYLKRIRAIIRKSTLSDPFMFMNEFIICRAIWSVTRQSHTPQFQKWSYILFTTLLRDYLKDENLWDSLKEYESLFHKKPETQTSSEYISIQK